MSATRPVRIPRARVRTVARAGGAAAPTPPAAVGPIERRPNVAGSQRAIRLALLYVVGLALLYLLFVAFDWVAPAASGSGVRFDLVLFGVAALLFAAAGALVALHAAPRGIEITPTEIVVVGRWGRRTEWGPREELRFRVVRRFPAGPLSSDPVETLELSVPGRPPCTYLVAEGLFPSGPAPA